MFERCSTINCYYHHTQNSKYSNSTLQATKGKLKLTFDKFNVEWSSSCKKKDYLYVGNVSSVNILQISIIKVISVIQVAKYNKLYLCGSSMPSDFKLTSKVTWIIQNTIFFLTTFPGKNYDFEVQVKQVCGQTRIQSHSHRYGWQ